MPISRANARTYVARILGGAGQQNILDMAEEAILKGFSDWQTATNWEGTLKDTSLPSAITYQSVQIDGRTLLPITIGDYDSVNLNCTVTGYNIPPGTVVSNYTRDSKGIISSISLSNPVCNGSTALWTKYPINGLPPTLTQGQTVFDPVGNRFLFYGGGDGSYADYSTKIYSIPFSSPTLASVLPASGTPPIAETQFTMCFDPIRYRLVLYGGVTALAGMADNNIHFFDLTTLTWSTVTPSGTAPAVRYEHNMIYDPVRDQMIIFGGSNNYSLYFTDTWALSLDTTPSWTQLGTTGYSGRKGAVAVYAPDLDKIIMWGGSTDSATLITTYAYAVGANAWGLWSPTGAPSGKVYANGWYDIVKKAVFVWGGGTAVGGGNYGNDLYMLSTGASPSWTQVSQLNEPIARSMPMGGYNSNLNLFTVLGGVTGTFPYYTYMAEFYTLSTSSPSQMFIQTDIPLVPNTRDYNVPNDFYKPYTARLISNRQWPLEFIRPRLWNKKTINDTTSGTVECYTIFNTNSSNTQNYGTKRLRVYRTPSANDLMQLAYYRKLDPLSDPLDIQDDYLYKFLDYCSSILLQRKKALDNPDGFAKETASNMQAAMTSDSENAEDEDIRMISQMEIGNTQRPLWTNGAFNPDYGW